MNTKAAGRRRFEGYLECLRNAVGHVDRWRPLEAYLTGLLLSGERKSVEPMAAKVEPRQVSRAHQSMHHFVADAPWDDDAVLAVARDHALAQLERHAPVAAWVIDETSVPKKGKHSVGVAAQYCGALGKTANCQVAVTLSLVNETMSVPAAWRLYLPEAWAGDAERRQRAGVPEEMRFLRKWEIALAEIDRLLADELPPAPVVADAGYGDTTEFREALTGRGFSYVVGIKGETTLWAPGTGPLPPAGYTGRGRPPTRVRRSAEHRPVSARQLAQQLPASAWREVRWREGTRGAMKSRFAAVRVRPAHRDELRSEARPVEWLLIEWPNGEPEPTKYWLSTVPEDVEPRELISLAKIRWRIERDYQELKDELGLDHYEGRGWRGFHHHGVLCIAAYAFLAAERGRLSPPQAVAFLQPAPLPRGFTPRGAPRPAGAA
ncbi:MAG: family transposase [Gemmatimonadetes bacterium]|nr:family transposase [Gemmatimonadota bacterium]